MTNNDVISVKTLEEAGAIFASALTTDDVELSNYKDVIFEVTTGAGTAADTTVTAKAKLGVDGTAVDVPFYKKAEGEAEWTPVAESDTFKIGGTAGATGKVQYQLTADDIAGIEADRVALSFTAVENSTVVGAIIAIQKYPRYTA